MDLDTIEKRVIEDPPNAAQEHLAAGRTITYSDEIICSPGEVIFENPDGQKEVKFFDKKANEFIFVRKI